MAEEPGGRAAVQPMPVTEITAESGAETPVAGAETPKTTTSASRRVRARLARRMTAQRSTVNPVLEPLIAVHREVLSEGRPGHPAARLRGGRSQARHPTPPLR